MSENIDFGKLNSMTKYPEIKTYHKIGEKGRLQPELSLEFDPDKMYHVSEKIDGTNTRAIFVNSLDGCDYYIGSREEILYAKGDRIINPTLDIVENCIPECERIAERMIHAFYGIYVVFSELYGGSLPASKQYTNTKAYAKRVFDIMYISPAESATLFEMERDKIALWRANSGQYFFDTDDRVEFCKNCKLECVPFIENIFGYEIPTDVQETYDFLCSFKKSNAGIDCTGYSEGIVIRSNSRSVIAKLRFEDYERTLGIKRK